MDIAKDGDSSKRGPVVGEDGRKVNRFGRRRDVHSETKVLLKDRCGKVSLEV